MRKGHCKVWKKAIAIPSGAGPLPNSRKGGRQRAQESRAGRQGWQRALFVPVSPSLLSQLRFETPQGKRAGHLLHSGELIPEMNVFSQHGGWLPSLGSRLPAPAAASPLTPPRCREGISSAGTNLARTPFP